MVRAVESQAGMVASVVAQLEMVAVTMVEVRQVEEVKDAGMLAGVVVVVAKAAAVKAVEVATVAC